LDGLEQSKAWEIFAKYLETLKVDEAPKLALESHQAKFGRFRKPSVNIPFSQSMVDLRLASDIFPSDPIVDQLVERHQHALNYTILVGRSGCSKTRTLFDVARRIWMIYMEMGKVEDDRIDPTTDRNFLFLVQDLRNNQSHPDFKAKTDQRIVVEITARLAYLYIFRRNYPTSTPQDFLLSQINGGQCVITSIVGWLRFETENDLVLQQNSIMQGLKTLGIERVSVAIDEANVGYNLFHGRWESPNTHMKRGLLSPLLWILKRFGWSSVLVAGTGVSLSRGETVQSDLGKPEQTWLVTDFPDTTEEAVAERLQFGLDLSDIDMQKLQDLDRLTGRRRLVASVFDTIITAETKDQSKQAVLDSAITKAIDKVKDKMKQRLLHQIRGGEKSLVEAVMKLYIGLHIGECGVSPMGKHYDLINLGIGELVPWNKEHLVIVRESITQEVIKEVVEENETVFQPFKHLTQLLMDLTLTDPSSKGFIWQDIVTFQLIKMTESAPVTVREFLEPFLMRNQASGEEIGINLQDLPKWTATSFLQVTKAKRAHDLGYKDDVEAITGMLAGKHQGILIKPTPSFRADSLQVRQSQYGTWMLSTSQKCLAQPLPRNLQESDLHSTSIDHYYRNRSGSGMNSPNLRAKLDRVLEKITYLGSFRIHVIVPQLSGQSARNRIQVIKRKGGGEDVLLYIDNTNLDIFFGNHASTVRELIAFVTNEKNKD